MIFSMLSAFGIDLLNLKHPLLFLVSRRILSASCHFYVMASSSTILNTSVISADNPSISLIKVCKATITKVTMGDRLMGPNWLTWQVQMMSLLALWEVEPYIYDKVQQPNLEEDPVTQLASK